MHAKLKQQFLEHENEPPLLCLIGIHFLAERRKKKKSLGKYRQMAITKLLHASVLFLSH